MDDAPDPQKIKFYTDTHIARAVAVQLRTRGVDIVRCEEVGMAEASDEEHLDYASREARVMISQDRDFARLHAQWQEAGKRHNGIMLIPTTVQGEAQISFTIRELLSYSQLIEDGAGSLEDIQNQLIYL